MAVVASEKVLPVRAGDGRQGRPNFVTNPATGALEPTPEFMLKARKALAAELRRRKFILFLRILKLQLLNFLLKLKCARLSICHQLCGVTEKYIHRSHIRRP